MPNSASRPARRRTIRGAVAAFTLLSLIALLPGTALAATPPITFGLEMFDSCIGGHSGANVTIDLVWRDSTGALKDQGSTTSGNFGSWSFCSTAPGVWVVGGDKIKASDGTYTRKYVVPNLTLILDRASNMATGTGPAGRTIRVCSTWSLFGDYEKCHGVRVGQDGQWAFDPGRDIRGGIWARVAWTSPNNDFLGASAQAPFVAVTLGKPAFFGVGSPRANVAIYLGDSYGAIGHATGDQWGGFGGKFHAEHGQLVSVAVGDHLTASIASDADWIVPDVDGSANKTTDVVTGKCWDTGTSGQFVEVIIMRSGHDRGHAWQGTEPDGTFTLDFQDPPGFSSPANIRSNDHITVACWQATGDKVQLKFRVP
jgi:hypothetical protein